MPQTDELVFVDLFCGGGGSGSGIIEAIEETEKKPVGVFINHWDKAINIHSANHPDHIHLCTGVDNVHPSDVIAPHKKLTLLWGSPECFTAGTLIFTRKGLRPIEEISVGDFVLTHKGRYRAVTRCYQNSSRTVSVSGYGHYGLVTTPNHPFYSKKIVRRWDKKHPQTKARLGVSRTIVENPSWIDAKDMEGKLWASPYKFPPLPISLNCGASLSDTFFWYIGRWLGDGSINKGDVEISCGRHECKSLERWMDLNPLVNSEGVEITRGKSEKRTATTYRWGCQLLADWIKNNFGTGAENKSIPAWCLGMQLSWRENLLLGYVSADGHVARRSEASSVSKKLALGMRLVALSVGKNASFYFAPPRDGKIEGRGISGKEQWRSAWTTNPVKKTTFRDSKMFFSPVRKVIQTGRVETVYNIEVKEDHSYVADGIVVHNCTHHSVARGGKPMNEQSRATAWCMVRWIRHKRPDHVLIENVKEFIEWAPLTQKKSKDGLKVWVKTLNTGSKKKKTVEVTEIPFRQERGEHRRSWLRRLSVEGYEMALCADPRKKGQTFREWKRSIQKMGYMVEYKILRSCDFGDPTIRRRVFVNCVRIGSGKKIVWPEPTHAKPCENGIVPEGMLPWNTARHLIDFSNIGTSIFTRETPLVKNTLKRLAIGLSKFGLKDLDGKIKKLMSESEINPFIVPQQRGGRPITGIDEPISAVTTSGAEAVAFPVISRLESFQVPDASDARSNQPASVDEPVRTVVCRGAGFVATPEIAILDGCVIQNNGESDAQDPDSPLGSVLGGIKHHLMTPMLVKLRGESHCFPISDPLGTVSANGLHHALMHAFLTCIGERDGEIGQTILGKGVELEPFIAGTAHSGNDASRVKDLLDPLNTACGNRGDQALVRPWLYTFYSQGSVGSDIDAPVPTSTVKDRLGVCYPVIEVEGMFFVLDIYFRMFTLRELARAQGFNDTYRFPGTKTDGVKAIGNSVSNGVARALALAAITQNSKIPPYEPDFIREFNRRAREEPLAA